MRLVGVRRLVGRDQLLVAGRREIPGPGHRRKHLVGERTEAAADGIGAREPRPEDRRAHAGAAQRLDDQHDVVGKAAKEDHVGARALRGGDDRRSLREACAKAVRRDREAARLGKVRQLLEHGGADRVAAHDDQRGARPPSF
jgi:hypothetical protein